jgi:hypothetical protein
MKSLHLFATIILNSTLPVVCISPASAECRIEKSNYRGWATYKLSNELVLLHVAPDIGGRVIQFQLGDHPFFFVSDDLAGKVFPPEENGGGKGGWKNYGGSKVWPAPQGWETDAQWPGPPDPVLDGGRYRAEITANTPDGVAVTVTSPPDARTGIQFARTISLSPGSTRVRLECAMRNISLRPVRWAIWEVTQLDAADRSAPTRFNSDLWAYCPLNPRSLHAKGFYPIFGQATHPSFRADEQEGLLTVRFDYRVGKVGLDSNAGWLAVANGQSDHCFVAEFGYVPGAAYPDNASVEFWLNGAGEFIVNGQAFTNAPDRKETPYLIEAEILSPLADLQPEQEYRFEINWFAARCPRPVVEMTPAGPVSKRLALTLDGNQARAEGVFGVFCPGRALAIIKDAFGNVVGQTELGRVDPNQVFRLNHQLSLPEKAFRVTIVLMDLDGQNRGALANRVIPERYVGTR